MSKARTDCSCLSGTILHTLIPSDKVRSRWILYIIVVFGNLGLKILLDRIIVKYFIDIFSRALLAVRSQYGMLNDGTRFHVISHLIRETVNCGKSMLASSIMGRDDSDSGSSVRESGSIQNLIQKDRVLAAVSLLLTEGFNKNYLLSSSLYHLPSE